MVRSGRIGVAAVLLAALLPGSAASAAAPGDRALPARDAAVPAGPGTAGTVGVSESVHVPVSGAGPDRGPAVDCSGLAPEQMLCTGSFTLSGDFGIRIAFATSYRGTLQLRGSTTTGSVTVLCDMLVYGPPCSYEHAGTFFAGQRFDLVSAATGSGFWLVQAPV